MHGATIKILLMNKENCALKLVDEIILLIVCFSYKTHNTVEFTRS